MSRQGRRRPKQAMLASACALALLVAAMPARAEDDAARDARWAELRQAIFGDRAVADGAGLVQIEAPARALDAALVPVSVSLSGKYPVKALYLVVDNNPSPLAATFHFGALADPSSLKLRVRVDQYTRIQAVAEAEDGRLFMAQTFVKAAGGCSAPAGSNDEQALRDLGEMKLRVLSAFVPGKPVTVQLLIRHPNFNGMQMNQLTRLYTPARFLDETEVSFNGAPVMQVSSDISMSTDPAITFSFVPPGAGALEVLARDSKGSTFRHSFDLPAQNS